MSRHFRARRSRLWTVAGLAFLSGCGGVAADAPVAGTPSPRESLAARPAAQSSLLAARHTLDAAVVPAWYPFDDPPMPALLPADGAANDADTTSEPPRKEPTVVRPSPESGTFQRFPAAAEQDAPEPGSAGYDVDSRYSLEPPAAVPQDSTPSTQTHREESAPQNSPAAPAPAEDAAPHEDAVPRGVFQRLPPVEHRSPEAPSGERDPGAATVPAVVPDVSGSRSPVEPRSASRPSDLFADEALPVQRPTYGPGFEAPQPRTGESAPLATAPTYVAPPAVERSEPIVLPPIEAQPNPGETTVVAGRPPRHREMQLINDRAAEGVRTGFALAHRGALYSAQAEFAAALRVVAQALDAQENTSRHLQALAAGLTALDESEDFLAGVHAAVAPLDIRAVVAKHRTPVLKEASPDDLTQIVSLQRYYTFAQEQLAAAVEHEPAASQALYGMGKVQTTLQASRTGSIADGPKAIALHQAALLVDDRNYMAANELGVLMARCGRYDAARAALAHSVSISPQPAVWRNLAAVHEHLGETSLAANARAAADNYAKSATPVGNIAATPQQPVVWLDPAAFAQSTQPQADLQRGQPAAATHTAPTASPASAVPQTSDKKSGFRWPLW